MGKLEPIKILGDTYFLRRTFDIVDYRGDIYGYDIFDDNNCFIKHYDIGNINDVVTEFKWDIYRILSWKN